MRSTTAKAAVSFGCLTIAIFWAADGLASGPRGGISGISTPAAMGSRGHASRSGGGFSFGGAGISIGRSNGRVTIGATSGGGITLGVGGRNSSTPSINVDPRSASARRSHHTPHTDATIPPDHQFRALPSNQLPSVRPPAGSEEQPNQDTPTTLPPNVKPQSNDPEPGTNSVTHVARTITDEEVVRAREFFQNRLRQLTRALEHRVASIDFDAQEVTALMHEHAVPPAVQIQIFDALHQGNYDQAKKTWMELLPRLCIPFRPSRITIVIKKFYARIEQDHVTREDVRELAYHLPLNVDGQRPDSCCGADDLVNQLEQEVGIHELFYFQGDHSQPYETETSRYSKPRTHSPAGDSSFSVLKPSESHTSNMTNFGKPFGDSSSSRPADSFSKPSNSTPSQDGGREVSIPSGIVNIVYHPKLPLRQVVVINDGTVMVGTGGEGIFRTERNYVAAALGFPMGGRVPQPESAAQPVTSGILIVNPTRSSLAFRFGQQQVRLASNQQTRFAESNVITFDRGTGEPPARYTLEPGSYFFTASDSGWDLHRRNFQLVIGNRQGQQPFRYIVQGNEKVLEPGQTATEKDKYPLHIRFDRGNGSVTKQVRWTSGRGELQVAINPADNLWDLYDTAVGKPEERSELQPVAAFTPAF
jgi:hypothetical protein